MEDKLQLVRSSTMKRRKLTKHNNNNNSGGLMMMKMRKLAKHNNNNSSAGGLFISEEDIIMTEIINNLGGLMMKKMSKLAKHNNNNNNNNSAGGLFSEDIMAEIFLWLPLKSLNRFKRLSKRWYFLISDKHNNSYFRRNYLSTFSSSSCRRRRNRIVGRSDDDNSAIMAGFFTLKPIHYWKSNEPVRFLPTTSTQFKKYSFLPSQGKGGGVGQSTKTTTTTITTTTEVISINKINPFLSFEESLDKFFSARLHEDEESYPSVVGDRKIFVAASSNGFLFCTLCSGFSHITDYLVNPVTMEWLALPKLEPVETVYLGFVCKGDYPSLDLVEYTIVRLLWREEEGIDLLFKLLSSSSSSSTGNNNEWIEYRVSCESLVEFDLCETNYTMIVSTTTTTTNNQGGGGSRILVYFLVRVRLTCATAIVVIDLNVGDESLQMFETPPGPDGGIADFNGADYIREFDDGVIHYVRFFCATDFHFWVLNTQSGEWYLKHTARLRMMLSKYYSLSNFMKWGGTLACYHIHGFHPMNPNLIFLTFYGKFACYNVETGIFEMVYDFKAQNVKYDYSHFVYQWPCWPPLL